LVKFITVCLFLSLSQGKKEKFIEKKKRKEKPTTVSLMKIYIATKIANSNDFYVR
jgi:hypothetical protein